jgi:hypothetical protein
MALIFSWSVIILFFIFCLHALGESETIPLRILDGLKNLLHLILWLCLIICIILSIVFSAEYLFVYYAK